MLVPQDPKEEEFARISNSIQDEELPDTISICKSASSANLECTDCRDFEHCAVCQEPFQDGELLRVLPCQHLFHAGCIGKWLPEENAEGPCIISGCSLCRKNQPKER
eukprot:141767_1